MKKEKLIFFNNFETKKLWSIYFLFLLLIVISYLLTGCYSFTGGNVPDYLKTLQIATVNDNSGFGNPIYREQLTQNLINKFRGDHSFTLVEFNGDAKLSVVITEILDMTTTVRPGEVETQRKVTVTCSAQYYDNVKKRAIWEKKFSSFGVYNVANLETGRDQSIQTSLDQISEDILLSVVSGW
jgi:hypothetical protein